MLLFFGPKLHFSKRYKSSLLRTLSQVEFESLGDLSFSILVLLFQLDKNNWTSKLIRITKTKSNFGLELKRRERARILNYDPILTIYFQSKRLLLLCNAILVNFYLTP